MAQIQLQNAPKKTAKYLHLHCIQWQQPQTLKKSDVAETNIQQPPKNDNYMYVCMYMHAQLHA